MGGARKYTYRDTKQGRERIHITRHASAHVFFLKRAIVVVVFVERRERASAAARARPPQYQERERPDRSQPQNRRARAITHTDLYTSRPIYNAPPHSAHRRTSKSAARERKRSTPTPFDPSPPPASERERATMEGRGRGARHGISVLVRNLPRSAR
jgi:hypothetical protein